MNGMPYSHHHAARGAEMIADQSGKAIAPAIKPALGAGALNPFGHAENGIPMNQFLPAKSGVTGSSCLFTPAIKHTVKNQALMSHIQDDMTCLYLARRKRTDAHEIAIAYRGRHTHTPRAEIHRCLLREERRDGFLVVGEHKATTFA